MSLRALLEMPVCVCAPGGEPRLCTPVPTVRVRPTERLVPPTCETGRAYLECRVALHDACDALGPTGTESALPDAGAGEVAETADVVSKTKIRLATILSYIYNSITRGGTRCALETLEGDALDVVVPSGNHTCTFALNVEYTAELAQKIEALIRSCQAFDCVDWEVLDLRYARDAGENLKGFMLIEWRARVKLGPPPKGAR